MKSGPSRRQRGMAFLVLKTTKATKADVRLHESKPMRFMGLGFRGFETCALNPKDMDTFQGVYQNLVEAR